eukprot:289914_1
MSLKAKRLNGNNKSHQKDKTMNIYTPRPGGDEDIHKCEQQNKINENNSNEFLGRYKSIRELGRGSYGIVYEGNVLKQCGKLEIGMKVAIKTVGRVFNTETDAKRLLRELRILRILKNHDSIVTLYDIVPP